MKIILLLLIALSSQTTLELNSRIGFLKKNAISCPAPSSYTKGLEEISINDNRKPAGQLKNGVLYLNLEVRTGNWYPETHDGMPIKVYALAEVGKPLQIPGPLIRVPEGTMIQATVHNAVAATTLMLHGFYSRPGNSKDSAAIAYGKTYKVQFKTSVAGTYSYRVAANSFKRTNGLPYHEDSQLYGALIVDKKNRKVDPDERIMIIGMWNDTLNGKFTFRGEEKVINGLSWPYTERLYYSFGRKINWRLINASNQQHPMHLHGFYYTVNSKGNGDYDQIYLKKNRRLVVTEPLQPGENISVTWEPNRVGNWLFHCHTLVHITPESALRQAHTRNGEHVLASHARDGMGGLIVGIQVQPSKNVVRKNYSSIRKSTLTLIAKEQSILSDTQKLKAFELVDKDNTVFKQASVPGPLIVLSRNEPVSINIINQLKDPTSVLWHGLEIESYFDGVAGWGNSGNELAPLLMPGDSFKVYITPPRAGTFMYHTHMHDMQLLAGLYGPLIVLGKGERFNPEKDKIFLISQGGPDYEHRIDLLNGTERPDTLQLKVGGEYRFRLINIKLVGEMRVSLLRNEKPVHWKMIAKDCADIPRIQLIMKPAVQDISTGETMDFSIQPTIQGHYTFEVKNIGNGKIIKMPVDVWQ
jgi:FtsP/CotA-like multicopper oxidase with cupredoxin domain